MTKSLREQQTDQTRQALVKAGRMMFGRKGFAEISAQEIVVRARVTRGALYHHFAGGKPGLFEAVARNLQTELVSAMSQATKDASGPWEALRAAIGAYFEFADDRTYQQITLQDAPAVIGANAWRAIEHEFSLKFIERGLKQLMEEGEIRAVPIHMLASTIFGACCEATLTIAEVGDAEKAMAKSEATDIVLALIQGLRRPKDQGS